jgi:DMSO/TMAO reductase YedYZ molybdopterin-dependent catalytic subunit
MHKSDFTSAKDIAPGPSRSPDLHSGLTRRHFLSIGGVALAGWGAGRLWSQQTNLPPATTQAERAPGYLTREEDFRNVGRGKPPPCDLPEPRRREVGLVRETWQLEVLADPESDAKLDRPLTQAQGTALKWSDLLALGETKAVRFLHVMACTNMPGPLGIGLWEGVPLRDILWQARPTSNVRRVFYYGYHNDDPKQRFQSSLTLERVLEDPPGEWPVILCYKFNGRWLTPKRGGPVRMVVPGLYANKSVKWLQRIVLTNNPRLNDTYADWNNDTESQLKTCASFDKLPANTPAGRSLTIRGVAQVGMSGLSRVQFFVHPKRDGWPVGDPHFTTARWQDAEMLPAPATWGGGLPNGELPPGVLGFSQDTGRPAAWPLRDSLVHWTAVLEKMTPGEYVIRCRTIDAKGVAQPMPRPFLKSGHNAIQQAALTVEA